MPRSIGIECYMSEVPRLLRFFPAILTVLALVAGCATVAGTTPKKVETPKEDTEAGIERWESQRADQRTWIEKACPREFMGPSPWKRCAERNLQAIQGSLLEPEVGTRGAERGDIKVERLGLPEPDVDTRGASQYPASAGKVAHYDGRGSNVATRAEPRRIVEKITGPESTDHTTTDTPPAPPRLAVPVDGERWFCYTNPLSALTDQSPEIVLTREGETDQPFGKGRVLVANVIYDAIFQIEGISRRWDWSDDLDSISVNPSGDGAYFNFRLLEPGKKRLPPSQKLWCNQK